MNTKSDIQLFSREFRASVNQRLDELIDNASSNDALTEAIRYSLLAPGKRLRPLISDAGPRLRH